MRTRRSPRNQDRLFKAISRELAAKARPSQIPTVDYSGAAARARMSDGSISASRFIAECDAEDRKKA